LTWRLCFFWEDIAVNGEPWLPPPPFWLTSLLLSHLVITNEPSHFGWLGVFKLEHACLTELTRSCRGDRLLRRRGQSTEMKSRYQSYCCRRTCCHPCQCCCCRCSCCRRCWRYCRRCICHRWSRGCCRRCCCRIRCRWSFLLPMPMLFSPVALLSPVPILMSPVQLP